MGFTAENGRGRRSPSDVKLQARRIVEEMQARAQLEAAPQPEVEAPAPQAQEMLRPKAALDEQPPTSPNIQQALEEAPQAPEVITHPAPLDELPQRIGEAHPGLALDPLELAMLRTLAAANRPLTATELTEALRQGDDKPSRVMITYRLSRLTSLRLVEDQTVKIRWRPPENIYFLAPALNGGAVPQEAPTPTAPLFGPVVLPKTKKTPPKVAPAPTVQVLQQTPQEDEEDDEALDVKTQVAQEDEEDEPQAVAVAVHPHPAPPPTTHALGIGSGDLGIRPRRRARPTAPPSFDPL